YLWPKGANDVVSGDPQAFGGMRKVYEAIDRAIGQLRATLPADTLLLVVSGDGVRPNRAGWHLLPTVLEKLGYVNAPEPDAGGSAAQAPRVSLTKRLKSMVPPKARRVIADLLPRSLREKLGEHLQSSHINWSRTRAYTLPTDLEGCIRINVRGREPEG